MSFRFISNRSLGIAASACAGVCFGQIQMASGPRLVNTDIAVLEAGEVRKDLPCTVTPAKPALGFDLKFHSGYDVTLPLKELAGSDNHLTMVFRVYPEHKPDEAAYFSQRWNVPAISTNATGTI